MITRKSLGAIALATTCLAPLAAFAADPGQPTGGTPFTGYIELGVGGVAGSNANQAGRYSGLNTTGINAAVTEFQLSGRPAWNSTGTRYYELTGENLVYQTGTHLGSGLGSDSGWSSKVNNSLLNSGSIGFKVGDQGSWGAAVSYDAITYTGNVIDSLYTVNGGRAALNNNLAPWGGATFGAAGPVTSFTIPTLLATGAMQPFQTGVRRDIIGGNFKYLYGDWTFTGAIRHEHKEGSMEEAFYQPYGGEAFALPVDYDTDRYDVTAAYNTRPFQAQIQYTFSHFADNVNFVNLPYPTSNTAVPFQRSAAYSTPPSNEAHYVTIMLGSNNLIPKTRLNLNARVGVEKQDDTFAPNTGDPNPAGATGLLGLNNALQGTTSNSLNAVATVYQVKASASTHPIPNFDGRVYYGLDGRDVSINQHLVTISGGGGDSDSSFTGTAIAVPQTWFKQNAGVEAGYRVLPQSDTKMTVGYRWDGVSRSNAQVGHSSTNTVTAALSSEIGSQIDGKLSFEYADRSGAINWIGPWSYLGQGSTYSGAYYQAPMTSEAVTLRADYTPMRSLTSGLFMTFKNEDFHYGTPTVSNGGTLASLPATGSGQGIKQDYSLVIGPDVNYRPTKDTNLHLFYTYEMLFFDNRGNGACSTAATIATAACAGSIGYFQNKTTNGTHTVGIAGDWNVTSKFKLKGEYTFSYGSVMFGNYNGVYIANPTASYQNVSNYPDINSTMHSIRLTASYDVTPTTELALRGMFTSFSNNDWNDTANAIQGNGSTAISLLTPGYGSPNYSILAIMAGVRFKL